MHLLKIFNQIFIKLKFKICLFLVFFIIFHLINVKISIALEINMGLVRLKDCSSSKNCILENWSVNDANKGFNELIEILENTPRITFKEKEENYVHALSTSRILKFIDDIEIKKLDKENILQVKSSSRLNLIDFGVNKRRVETLHFRLIDIYKN